MDFSRTNWYCCPIWPLSRRSGEGIGEYNGGLQSVLIFQLNFIILAGVLSNCGAVRGFRFGRSTSAHVIRFTWKFSKIMSFEFVAERVFINNSINMRQY